MITLIEITLSVGVLATLVTVISACICGCKNTNQKSELVGTAGVVKLRFDEETPSPTPTTPASVKRASTQNSHRSLPEIPHPVGRHDSGDTTSEIYATVNLDLGNQVAAEASTSREHPYEHAYAKLQNENHNIIVEITPDQRTEGEKPIDERDDSHSGPESVVISASVAISGQLPSSQELPYITPPPLDHNAQHFSGDSTDSAKGYTSISVREPLSSIRAQSGKPPSQPHYATVSDDSDEMYAAIDDQSAGNGSDTYAQIAPQESRAAEGIGGGGAEGTGAEPRRSLGRERGLGDSHARRSAPPEIGTSAAATHSRQASSSSCTNSTGALGSPKPEKRQANSPLPPPPRTGAPSQASAPNASAPNPAPSPAEPRGRSPAPLAIMQQRISSTGDLPSSHDKLRRSLNEKHQRNHSCVSSSDFYGCNYPVDKHRFSSGELLRPLVARELHFDIDKVQDNLYNDIDLPASDYSSADASTDRANESPSRNLEEMYAKVIKKKSKDEPTRSKESEAKNADDPGYETIDRKKTNSHGYETISHKQRKTSQNQEPGYETVKDIHKPNNFSNNNKLNNIGDSGPNSIISSSDGYEHINKIDNSASDSDPNYEVLRNQPPTPPYATIASSYKLQPTYSTVNKKPGKYEWAPNNNDEQTLEPTYESMPTREPLYTPGSESDPNYESVRPKDPNYETVSGQEPNYESLRLRDPKYESVRSKASTKSKDPNYESVKYFDLNKEPPYEKVGSDTGIERSDSNAGYESINVANNREARSSINNGADTVSDYFQV